MQKFLHSVNLRLEWHTLDCGISWDGYSNLMLLNSFDLKGLKIAIKQKTACFLNNFTRL